MKNNTFFKIGFSLGNGPSRAGLEMAALKSQGIVYGCNAIYKEDERPDVLVALDKNMVSEIQAAGYPARTAFKKNDDPELIMVDSTKGNIRLFRENLILSAGAVSLWLLCYVEHCTHIFLIGHDLSDPTDKLCPFFLSGLWFAVAPWKLVQFYRMIPPHCHVPPELGELANLIHIPPIANWFREPSRRGEMELLKGEYESKPGQISDQVTRGELELLKGEYESRPGVKSHEVTRGKELTSYHLIPS